MNDFELRQWLRYYGYHRFIGLGGNQVATANDAQMNTMVREAQAFLGVTVDGDAGIMTKAAMMQPRCGCPDYPKYGSRSVPAFGKECAMSIGVYANWTGIKGRSPDNATEIMIANFKQAEKFNIRMHMVDDPRDALINIRMGRAQRGVLAWMEVGDGCGWQHQSLFNIDVNWSNDLLFAGTNMHEVVGHGAGVGHSPNVGSIMDPVFSSSVKNVIDPWFSKQMEKRYGLFVGPPTPEPEPEPDPHPPEPDPQPSPGSFIDWIIDLINSCSSSRGTASIIKSLKYPSQRDLRRLRRFIKRREKGHTGLTGKKLRNQVDIKVDAILKFSRDLSNEEIRYFVENKKFSVPYITSSL